MAKKLTNDEVIKRFKNIHGDKYDYHLIDYKGTQKKVSIICQKHKIFNMTPLDHWNGHGCPICAGKNINTTEAIKRFKKVHGNNYDYSKFIYTKAMSKSIIICPKHGEFLQIPQLHWTGSGCPICAKNIDTKLSQKEVLYKFHKKHGDKYDYSQVVYKGSRKKIKIKCMIHGYFYQEAIEHWRGSGCPKCSGKNINTTEAIKRFKKVHGDKYNYSNMIYKSLESAVKIICPKHGYFYQKPVNHWTGSGCPKCSKEIHVSKGEKRILKYLEENNLRYKTEYKFKDCKNIRSLPFDFYLPKENTLIEYDGKQHFEAVEYFGGERTFLETRRRDKIKTDFAKIENIKLIRIPYTDFNKIEEILNKELIWLKN